MENWPELDNLRTEAIRERTDGWQILKAFDQIRNTIFNQLGEDPQQFPTKAQDVVATDFRPECWSNGLGHLMSAELATLLALRNDRIHPQDEIVLIHAESNIKDAVLIEAILKQLASQREFPTSNVRRKDRIDAKQPLDWDPKASWQFNQEMQKLWQIIVDEASNSSPLSLVLTGGYKGTLMDICLRMGHVIARGNGLTVDTIYYIHDGPERNLILLKPQRAESAPDESSKTVPMKYIVVEAHQDANL
jgi:hypothetical protein